MNYLPVFIDVRGRACLVVGGGAIGARKVELLQQAGAEVRVVAPQICPALRNKRSASGLELVARPFQGGDVEGMTVVVAATDQGSVNASVAAEARRRGIPVNVVDAPALCTFIMPALIDRDPVLVAVSTGGASPVLARLVRGRIEAALPSGLGRLAKFAAEHRGEVQQRLPPAARRRFWERVLEGPIADWVMLGRDEEARSALAAELSGGAAIAGVAVVLIGIGSGDPERLTLGSLRSVGGADFVLHDRAALDVVDRFARRDADRLEIDALDAHVGAIAQRVSADQRVCVVRAGDPYAVDASADEVLLRGAGLDCRRLRPAP